MLDIHEQCLKEVARIIKGLNLPGLSSDQIVVRRRPLGSDGQLYKGITISPSEEREAPGTNQREDIGYGVAVTDASPADTSLTENAGLVPERRSLIRRRFIHARLDITSISGANYCITKVEPGRLNDPPRDMAEKYEVSNLIIRCWVRESRTS